MSAPAPRAPAWRRDLRLAGALVALVTLGLAVEPVALACDVRLRVADSFLVWTWTATPAGDERCLRCWSSPGIHVDPWGRPFALRPFPLPLAPGRRSPLPLDVDPDALVFYVDPTLGKAMPAGVRSLVYSLGPDGQDSLGALASDDVPLRERDMLRLGDLDLVSQVTCWSAGLLGWAWLAGRIAGRYRRRWVRIALVLGSAAIASCAAESRWRLEMSALGTPGFLPAPGQIVGSLHASTQVVLTSTLAALLVLVGAYASVPPAGPEEDHPDEGGVPPSDGGGVGPSSPESQVVIR